MKFFGLDLEGAKLPPALNEIPKKRGVLMITNLGTIINWVANGEFEPYVYNRGSGRICHATAASCRNGVLEDAIGMLTLGKRENQFSSSDWHSRLYGILQRLLDGNLTAAEIAIGVPVRVVGDFLTSYRVQNASPGHKTSDKIQCPDLLFGNMWTEITVPLSPECVKLVSGKKWTVLSAILYSIKHLGRDTQDWEWYKIYQNRCAAMKMANNVAGEGLKVSKKDLSDISAAIQYWYELILAIKAGTTVNVAKIIRSAGFFGFIVSMRLSNTEFPRHNHTIVNRILRHFDEILRICPSLCRGDQLEIIEFCGKLRTHLRLNRAA